MGPRTCAGPMRAISLSYRISHNRGFGYELERVAIAACHDGGAASSLLSGGSGCKQIVRFTRTRTRTQISAGDEVVARGLSFEAVFVPGLAEKLFPHKIVEEPILLELRCRDHYRTAHTPARSLLDAI
jgi:hypothetical protein